MRAGREKPGVCGQQGPRSTIGHFIFLGLNSRSGRSAFAGDVPPGPAVPLPLFSRVLLCILTHGFESACVLGPSPNADTGKNTGEFPGVQDWERTKGTEENTKCGSQRRQRRAWQRSQAAERAGVGSISGGSGQEQKPREFQPLPSSC